jgi:hypothetical protein
MFPHARQLIKEWDYMPRTTVPLIFSGCVLFSIIGCGPLTRIRKADPMERVFKEENVDQQISQYLMVVKNELALYSDGIPDTLKPRVDSIFSKKFDSTDIRQGLYRYMRDAYGMDVARRHLDDMADPVAAKIRKQSSDSLTKVVMERAQSCLKTIEIGSDSILTAEYTALDPTAIFDSVPIVYTAITKIIYETVAWTLHPPFEIAPDQFAAKQDQLGKQIQYFTKLEPCLEIQRNPSEPPEFFFKYARFLRTKPNRDFEVLKSEYLIRRFKEAGAEIKTSLQGKTVAR